MVDVLEMAGSGIGLRRLELVIAMSEVEVRSGQEIMTEQFEDLHDDYVADWHVLQADLRWMKTEGWVEYEASAAGIQGVRLLGQGQHVAQRFSDARLDVTVRLQKARELVLRWLYECDATDIRSPRIQDFIDSKHGSYLGKQFKSNEITKAMKWLEDKGFMTGQYMQAGYYTYPKITTDGSDVLEEYGSLSNVPKESRPSVTTTTVHMNGSHGSNLNIGGNNVTQSTAMTAEQIGASVSFVESSRGLVPSLGLTEEQVSEITEVLDEVEKESSSPAPKRGLLVDLMTKARDIALLGSATAMVNAYEFLANGSIQAITG